jgi:hypothetical protein
VKIKFGQRLMTAIALSSLVVASAGAAAALGAAPIKGATYQGKLSRAGGAKYPISFKVSRNGKHIGSFKLSKGYPVYCQGGGFGALQGASGTITKKGTFKVKLPIYFAPAHSHQGFVIVTGTFAKHGKESGKVTTAFTHGSSCNGTSPYAAKG